MKHKRYFIAILAVLISASLAVGLVLADDGQMFRRNISDTPDTETEYAALSMMHVYVPAQTAAGELITIEYYDKADALTDTRSFAKPLVATFVDGLEEDDISLYGADAIEGGVAFGERDAFAAVSLDDGATWKNTNLSRSADLSSFTLANGHEYPGDVHYMTSAVEGRTVMSGTTSIQEYYVLTAWISKFCEGGTPAYTLIDVNDADGDGDTTEYLYPDIWGVAGSQGSVDYTLQGYPEIGEIPYGCIWTARGLLAQDLETGLYEVTWRKAERLTSGVRDANVVAVAGTPGAGFSLVWQEDPDGLRPGQGLGPGEGWSGAIVNQKTDMWYSHIAWEDFDDALIDELDPDTLPKVAVPMSLPLRLTDNNMCKFDRKFDTNGELINAYCYEDFNANAVPDFCAVSTPWTNPGGTTLNLCQTEDGRVLQGRTGASRTRMSLQPYTKADGTKSAWVIMAYEETKALGTSDQDIDPVDIGKNIVYHSFDMFTPDIVAQGSQLNAPAKDPVTGEVFPMLTDEFGNDFFETEIARRFALAPQPSTKAMASQSKLSLFAIFKQGIENQGGPADIMLRRFVLPDDFDPAVDNPYDFDNMVCEDAEGNSMWATDVITNSNVITNSRYINGYCLAPAINLSGTTAVACEAGDCPDLLPVDGEVDTYPRVTEWIQTVDNLDDRILGEPI